MNCPFHILIFKSRQRSYRELPLRMFEFGAVYRYEKSGVVHGLTRVRGMTQDDAHIFCSREQMAGELQSLLGFVLDLLRRLRPRGLLPRAVDHAGGEGGRHRRRNGRRRPRLSGRLRSAMDLELVLDPGGGAFYGPKISVQARDAIGRTWQMSTIQVDIQLPQRFEMDYVGQDNARHRPIMIHRALFGSVERFFARARRALRRGVPDLAVAGPGPGPARARRPHALRATGSGGCWPQPECGPRRRTPASLSGRGSAARSWRRCPTSSSWATPTSPPGPSASTPGAPTSPSAASASTSFVEQLRVEAAPPLGRGAGTARGSPVSLDHLWAGWRSSYVSSFEDCGDPAGSSGAPDGRRRGTGRVRLLRDRAAPSEPDEVRHVLWTGKFTVALLNAYPYSPGHVMVLPIRHVRELVRARARGSGRAVRRVSTTPWRR